LPNSSATLSRSEDRRVWPPPDQRGRRDDRRKALDTEKRGLAVDLYQEKKMPVGKICELMGISIKINFLLGRRWYPSHPSRKIYRKNTEEYSQLVE